MLETIAIISNGIVIVAIGALYRKINSQEEKLSKHLINFAEEITNRPDFEKMDKRIEKVVKPVCEKVSVLTKDFKHHRHEKDQGAVVLGA